MHIKEFETRIGTLHGSLGALEGDISRGAVRDAMDAALRLTEAVGDLSEVFISMLDGIEGDVDLENNYDREDDRERRFIPIYEVDQGRAPLGFRDTRKNKTC